MSDFLQLHGLQHARLPCPSLCPGAGSNSSSLSQWCRPTISFSVIAFSSSLQSFPASGSFPMSWLFASGIQLLDIIYYYDTTIIYNICAVLCLVAQSCQTLCNPVDCSPPGSSVHGDSPGKNTGVGYHALFQGIFPASDQTQVFRIAGGFFTT